MQKIYSFAIIATIFYVSLGVGATQAQEIVANVTINYELIPIDRREDIVTMKDDVEEYLNNMNYTGMDWEGDAIEVDLTIYLLSRSGNRYSANLHVVSRRAIYQSEGASVALRFFDQEWVFPYARNAVLSYQENRYDWFSSLIDFYMFVVIGMDLDTYGELDGTEMYDKARRVWQLGSASGAPGYDAVSDPGEFTRYNLISELNDLRYEQFRELIFAYYVDGMDLLAEDHSSGLKQINRILTAMVKFKHRLASSSVFLQVFFDAKHQELADLFKDYTDKEEVFRKLQFIDPSHSSVYQEALESR